MLLLFTYYIRHVGGGGIMVIKVFILCPWLTGQLYKIILKDVSRWQAQSTCVWDTNELINLFMNIQIEIKIGEHTYSCLQSRMAVLPVLSGGF